MTKNNMPFITIYTTNPNLKTAKKISSVLLKKRLIACANFFPITSMYWWGGKIQNDSEVVALLKTKSANWDKVKKEIEKIHPYDIPCIERLSVDSNKSYKDWIKKETKK